LLHAAVVKVSKIVAAMIPASRRRNILIPKIGDLVSANE
jgi:hypothetical protein